MASKGEGPRWDGVGKTEPHSHQLMTLWKTSNFWAYFLTLKMRGYHSPLPASQDWREKQICRCVSKHLAKEKALYQCERQLLVTVIGRKGWVKSSKMMVTNYTDFSFLRTVNWLFILYKSYIERRGWKVKYTWFAHTCQVSQDSTTWIIVLLI